MMSSINSAAPDPAVVSNIPTPAVRALGFRHGGVNPFLIVY
jgi:hypothetical protein